MSPARRPARIWPIWSSRRPATRSCRSYWPGQSTASRPPSTIEDRNVGQGFANGASDGARVDDLLLLTEYVRELETPHARLLSAVYRLDHPNARVGTLW